MPKREQFLSVRGQMFLAFLIPFLFLGFWTLSAFWEHIDQLKPTYRIGAKVGAMAGEVILLILIYQKCFSHHINVRKWALILTLVFGPFLLIHTAALRGLGEAQVEQQNLETRLRTSLTEMSKEQAGAIRADGVTQKERLANEKKAKAAQTEIMKQAQDALAKEITASVDKVKDNSILPRWYLDGWMYGAIFILGSICLGITGWLSMNKEDIDTDYNGTPDHLERPKRAISAGADDNPFPSELPETESKNGSGR